MDEGCIISADPKRKKDLVFKKKFKGYQAQDIKNNKPEKPYYDKDR